MTIVVILAALAAAVALATPAPAARLQPVYVRRETVPRRPA